jgi:FAD/FMN-containing dehydrogenase
MLPVSPGTSWVTIAGAIANDVHGKDHHVYGTFGEHVKSLTLARSSGEVLTCSRLENPDFLRATIGGLGLTGFILEATIQLVQVPSPYFDVETIPYYSVSEFFELSASSEKAWQGTVSWIDCSTSRAGRGIFTRGNPSSTPPATRLGKRLNNLRPTLPVTPPFSLVNNFTTDTFNNLYFKRNESKQGLTIQHYENFYYPLDGVANWNRIYGSKGFFQYQSVIPEADGREATEAMLDVIAKSGQGSFLSVLKTFADRPSAGLMSFARGGVTLALDFPNRGQITERLFQELDQIVMSAKGALNPSKDLRMPSALFRSGFQNWSEFEKFRDPACNSDFYKRVTQ